MPGILLYVIILLLGRLVDGVNYENNLYNALFNNGYNPKLRPVADISKPVNVELEFELASVGDLSETDQVMTTVGFLVAEWEDEYLKWTPASYGGVEHLVLPPNNVWLPDIGIINSADTFYHETFFKDFRVDIKYTGRVIWAFGGNFATSCTLDMTYYPFDLQKCTIEVENWSYTRDAVNLLAKKAEVVLTESFSENGEWKLNHTSVEISTYTEDIHPGKLFPKVTFNIFLERKPKYYFINIVTPCIFCIVIALLVFWLPPESGEKVSLGITVLLAFSVFQLIVADNTPKTSDFTPLLSQMMAVIMGMATISIITSILVLYLYHHPTTSRPPYWVRKLMFKYMARVMCMSQHVPSVDGVEPESDDEEVIVADMDQPPEKKKESEMSQILNHLRYLVGYLKDKEKDSTIEDEWRAVAMVTDRIFFWVTSILVICLLPVFLGQKDPTH